MAGYRSFAQHLARNETPKRILSIDGGGIRGVLTVGMLREIEAMLRRRFGDDPDFRLADYFDLIGGTSTGAIIAAGLALGMSVDEIHAHYLKLGGVVFKPALLRLGLIRQKYDAAVASKALESVFGDRTMASADFRTGLLVMTKRLDTGSPWPLTNNPAARYFGRRTGSQTLPNGEFPLWRVVRASAAAPYYFRPELIQISRADPAGGFEAVTGEFVDGGVSTANNPALQLLMTATLDGYDLRWQPGEDRLLMVSVGTGRKRSATGVSAGLDATSAVHAVRALSSLMDDTAELVETVLQWLSRSPTAREIDRDIATAAPVLGGAPMLSYVRYNAFLEPAWCREVLGIERSAEELSALAAMDRPDNIAALDELGRLAGSRLVEPDHFGATFDRGVVG